METREDIIKEFESNEKVRKDVKEKIHIKVAEDAIGRLKYDIKRHGNINYPLCLNISNEYLSKLSGSKFDYNDREIEDICVKAVSLLTSQGFYSNVSVEDMGRYHTSFVFLILSVTNHDSKEESKENEGIGRKLMNKILKLFSR